MKKIFDRYAKRLTPDERWAIWEKVSRSRRSEPRAWLRWTLRATAAAGVAVAVFAVAVRQREPARPDHTATTRLDKPSSSVEGSAPETDRLRPRAERRGEQGGIDGAPQRLAGEHRAQVARKKAQRVDIASPPEPGVQPTPMPAANGTRATIVSEAAAPPIPPAVLSPALVVSTGVLTGRITDSQNRPLSYASVSVKEARFGALAGEDGTYRIDRLPPATYTLQVRALGYEGQVREGIRVEGDQTDSIDIQMKEVPVKTLATLMVTGERRIDKGSSSTKQSISAERLRQLPVDNLRDGVSSRAGVVTQGGELHFRGGRSGDVQFQINGVSSGHAPPPVIPTTGGTRLPNDEAYDSMFFKNYGVNPFIATDEDALSTFAVDVDAASYTVARRYIDLGHLPPADAVRVEEFVNFFAQGYPRFESEDFRILIDGAPSPFGRGYHLLRIGIKGREIEERNRKPAQLTFVVDVSGSMAREDRLELVKRALRLLVDRLRDDDRVGIVVYGTVGRVLLEPVALGQPHARAAGVRSPSDDPGEKGPGVSGSGRWRILEAIEQLRPEGSTNAEDGLRLGYDMARRMLRPEAINRIVLCSDGVANVGATGPESILERVRTEADRGIHLTTIGFGMGNYNDVLMEQLANRGDGNYYYVDDLDEARRVFVENLTGTLQTIAKDAKIQVEFDSTRVLRYRLLGFENRDVADRDFRNDKVDAGEIGAGHEVTALYEVKLAPQATPGTVATVRFRYARPEQEGAGSPLVREIEQRFDAAGLSRKFEQATPRFRLDAAVAEFAEILRGSYWAKEGRLSDVLSVARSAARSLRDDTSAEFVSLVEKAAASSRRAKSGERREER